MGRKLFFYDDTDIKTKHGLHHVCGPVKKNGVIDWPRPKWDLERIRVFAGTIIQIPGGGLRMYYSGFTPEAKHLSGLAVAESADGIEWTKPLLGQVMIDGNDTNRILPEGMPGHGFLTQPQVVVMPDGTWLMWTWWHAKDVGVVRYICAESKDGIKWRITDADKPAILHPADRELGQNAMVAGLTDSFEEDRFADLRLMQWLEAKRLRSNDATYIYYNNKAGCLDMYSVWLLPVDESTHRMTPHDNAPRVIRTIHKRQSSDGYIWSDPEMLIMPDENDPLHQQFYYLAVHRDTGSSWNIGMLGNYRCWEQSMDIELCFSRDTHQWIRPLRGGWIPRGDIGDIDHMMVHAPNSLIDLGDRWRIIYSGTNIMHNKQMPEGIETARSDTMTADIPKGRFAGLSTTNRVLGTLTLKDFNLSSDIITVDADIQGRFQAELRDPYNRPLPGFELNRSIPVKGDSQCHVLRWQGEKTSDQYRYDTICMRIEMENGIIYSVSI